MLVSTDLESSAFILPIPGMYFNCIQIIFRATGGLEKLAQTIKLWGCKQKKAYNAASSSNCEEVSHLQKGQ
jgi:hypothetical protein